MVDFACICLCIPMYAWYIHRAEEHKLFPRTEVIDGYEPQFGCWESNLVLPSRKTLPAQSCAHLCIEPSRPSWAECMHLWMRYKKDQSRRGYQTWKEEKLSLQEVVPIGSTIQFFASTVAGMQELRCHSLPQDSLRSITHLYGLFTFISRATVTPKVHIPRHHHETRSDAKVESLLWVNTGLSLFLK